MLAQWEDVKPLHKPLQVLFHCWTWSWLSNVEHFQKHSNTGSISSSRDLLWSSPVKMKRRWWLAKTTFSGDGIGFDGMTG